MTDVFCGEQAVRYSRNMSLPEFGEAAQRLLLGSHVLIVGAGALGSAVAVALAAAGVGLLRIIDFDTVSLSNLPRQIAYTTHDTGKPKVSVLEQRLNSLNPDTSIETFQQLLTARNFAEMTVGIDIVVEGSDNLATKYMVSERCRQAGLPCVIGGVNGFRGQVMVFNPGDSPAYDEIFPQPPSGENCAVGTTCSQGAVYSPLPVIIGNIQASEAIKLLTGVGESLSGRMFTLDLLNGISRIIRLC